MHRSNPGPHDKPPSDLPPGDISDLAHLLRSPPPVPRSPAPAYTALPYRDVEFHLAPLVHGRPGDIELETTDGKRFLVHRKILEQETVFFHIYYGFVPVWRLAAPHIGPPHPSLPCSPPPSQHPSTTIGALNNLLCLPKYIASHLRSGGTATTTSDSTHETSPLLAPSDGEPTSYDEHHPPTPPPKDISAPTPTTNPYTWVVPESSAVLASFLSLIYPRGTFDSTPSQALPTLEITGRVIRAAMGYQSSKALNIARDRLSAFILAEPVDTYAMACFFKFADLARLASTHAIAVPTDQWTADARGLMGRSGVKNLTDLRELRLAGLRGILNRRVECDAHSDDCVRRGMMEEVWRLKVESLKAGLRPENDLLELLEIDLRGGHCGDCLVLLGHTIQLCLLAAKDLPTTI